MAPKRCLYSCPISLDHEGLKIKLEGQIAAFKKHYQVSLSYLHCKHKAHWLQKIYATLYCELSSIIKAFFVSLIYIRYNPKAILSQFVLCFFSLIKPVIIEHNTIMDTELRFLKRFNEWRLHRFWIAFYAYFPVQHIAVNHELKQHLIHLGLQEKRVHYIQNGYTAPLIK